MSWPKLVWFLLVLFKTASACQFFPQGEYLRFVRVPENLRVGEEFLRVEVHPRRNLSIQPVDKNGDVQYFTYRDLNKTTVSLLLARSLEDIVDSDNPQNVLKFRLMCDFDDGEDVITSSLSVTVYVEDLNDHSPVFEGTPYEVTVEELTPVGLTIFRGIHATDRDKPNTPNSDVQYAITAGNDRGKFALDNSHQAFLVLKKALDFDTGDREFILTLTASDRGLPPRSSNTTVKITVQDNDDLSPKFTKGIYRTKINEFYPLTGERIHKLITFEDPIYAYDQDTAIDTPIRYDIIAGNERHLFYLDHVNGSLFLEREIDLDAERSLPGNTFVLQIQASQLDNPLKTGVARVEIEVMDLNDNLPEFEVDFYNISIVENLPNGFSVLQIIATDQDQGDNGEFTYQLDDKTGAFTLDSRSGWLTVRDQTVLDREKRASIKMRVHAKEKVASVIRSRKASASSVGIEVTLLDANDNNPTFIPNNVYEFTISSEAKRGEVVGQVHAIDPDLGRNGQVMYSIQKNNNNSPFKINKTGQITLDQNEISIGRHIIFVEASDMPLNPSEKRISLAVVTVVVKNMSPKGLPDFIGAPYEFWVGANVDIGTSVGQIRITDVSDKRKIIYDLLHSYHEGVPFAVEERSGTITVVDELANYNRQEYEFEAVVTNEKDLSLVTNVTINVVGPNDDSISMMMKTNGSFPIEFHIKENEEPKAIGQIMQNATTKYINFMIANERDVNGFISIAPNGTLYSEKPFDREEKDVFRLTVIAEYNRGLSSGTGIYQVTIFVDDENDNSPKFEHEFYEGRLKENCISGSEVELNYPVHVSDADSGANAQFTVTLFGDGAEMFRLDKNSGKIYFNGGGSPIDREVKDLYQLRMVAKDKGGLYSQVKLNIIIEDENDNAPMFIEMTVLPDIGVTVLEYDSNKKKNSSSGVYSLTQMNVKSRNKVKMSPVISIPEDIPVGTTILKLRAEDKDQNDNSIVKYEIVSETYIPNELFVDSFHIIQYFLINRYSGEVSLSRNLPPESEFRLNISASDKEGLKDYVSVRIFVKDINDHQPVFKKSWYNFDTEEASYSRKVLGKIEATDADFGPNSNISYKILYGNLEKDHLPFEIAEYSGVLSVLGTLDRETKDKYMFKVIAKDNPISGAALSSSVNVEVNVLDVNDNAPTFYGYDDTTASGLPVYYVTVPENSPIGSPITRVFANDSDFMGNGNGLLLFDIPYRKNKNNLFVIDSKEGIVTTIGKLDYESSKTHNVTIVASDLGSPSLSSTALLIVNVIDVPEDIRNIERPVFAHRYYEVEVEENVPVPLKLLTLNVTESYRNHKLRYSIVADKNNELRKMFKIDPRNGTLFIIESPDRETRAHYELKIRLDQYKVGRDMTVMVYPVTNERLGDLGLNEVKVIIRVIDTNDNVPKFTITGRPFVVAIPTSANFGYNIMKLQAKDPDLGLNGEIRYQILGKPDESSRKFAIDPITGQVRAISSFSRDAGKVFGFDVKATDRRGADDGKSSIANVFVYVLDDQKQLVMIMGAKPTDIEKGMDNITMALYNATGYDVRIRKLEPHVERNTIDGSATDMYLYAVDPKYNVVVDNEQLQKAIQRKQSELEIKLDKYKLIALANGSSDFNHARSQRVLLSTLEIGVVVLGCIVFLGAFATAICVVCVRRKKRRKLQKSYSHTQPLSYTLATSILGKPPLFPATYGGDLRYAEAVNLEPSHIGLPRQHDPNCPLFGVRRQRERPRSFAGIETSVNSLHSSGQDSGIVEGQCQCGQSFSTTSSETSSNYEDSLKSVNAKKFRESLRRLDSAGPSRTFHGSSRSIHEPRPSNRTFSDDFLHHRSPTFHRVTSHTHLSPAPTLLVPGSFRSNERLVMACPMNP